MGEILTFEPTPEQFGVFWKYIQVPSVTDIDYNGTDLWITDIERGRFRAEEELAPGFINAFTHNIANCVNKQFNNANKILEADTRELRISIIHESVAASGISICIRKSPCIVRNTIRSMIRGKFCPEDILHLLINCVLAKMNFVFGGEPGSGKTECAKFFMQFIPESERVITIEDSLELHYAELKPNADAVELRVGPGFDYTDAIKACLRQNPKWLMLSEARSVEVTSLLEQWSTGVNGFTTIHLDDLRKLPDRICNMMKSVQDVDRMENRIYQYVNIGRENETNKCSMIIKDGKVVSRDIPEEILKKLQYEGIEEPLICKNFNQYIRDGK